MVVNFFKSPLSASNHFCCLLEYCVSTIKKPGGCTGMRNGLAGNLRLTCLDSFSRSGLSAADCDLLQVAADIMGASVAQ